jgi:hypothetical protein
MAITNRGTGTMKHLLLASSIVLLSMAANA